MSDTSSTTASTSRARSTASSESSAAGDRGTTTFADSVVSKIASLAAKEVRGVADLGGGMASAVGGVVGRIRGAEHSTAGVGVEVGEREAAIDLTLIVEYPAPLHQVADSVRQNVVDRVESMTGLDVVEVNVFVVDLSFPGSQEAQDEQQSARVQ